MFYTYVIHTYICVYTSLGIDAQAEGNADAMTFLMSKLIAIEIATKYKTHRSAVHLKVVHFGVVL